MRYGRCARYRANGYIWMLTAPHSEHTWKCIGIPYGESGIMPKIDPDHYLDDFETWEWLD